MLVLGIETSSRIGSVALVENGEVLAETCHDTPNSHGERLLGLIDELFARTERHRRHLNRVAVGRGPGAFTGLRIGLSLAQGIARGLSIPAVGMGSLRAMALGLASALTSAPPSLRVTLLDARRGELFLACYRDDGEELVPPQTIARERIGTWLLEFDQTIAATPTLGPRRFAVLGAVARELSPTELDRSQLPPDRFTFPSDPYTDYPSARSVALGASRDDGLGPATPEYLRDADAIKPNLPPCPLDLPRP